MVVMSQLYLCDEPYWSRFWNFCNKELKFNWYQNWVKSQIGEDLEYRPGSTHLPALLLSPLCMSSVMVKNNMSGRFSHLEMFFLSPVKVVLMLLKTKMGDLVIVTLFVILFLSSAMMVAMNMGEGRCMWCFYQVSNGFPRLLVHTEQTCIYGQSKKGKVQNIECRRKGIWPAFINRDP